MRTISALALAAAAGSTFGQDQGPMVTFSARAARASVVLAQLSLKTGRRLEATPAMADEILAVSVENQPLNTLLAHIASVSSGEWRVEGGVERLAPSLSLRSKDERLEMSRKVAAIRASIAKRLDSLKKAESSKQKMEAATKAQDQAAIMAAVQDSMFTSPEEKAVTLLLSDIDPTVLAELGSGDRIVFSTNATRMQHPLGANARAVLDEFVTAHNEEVSKQPAQEDPTLDGPQIPDFMKDMMKMRRRPILNSTKALLVVSDSGFGFGSMHQVELRFYDRNGNVLYSEQSVLDNPMDMLDGVNIPGMPATTSKKPAGTQTEVEQSADSKEFSNVMSQMNMGPSTVKLSPDLKSRVFQPQTYDPLSYFATDALFSLARLRHMPLVASVPDEMGFSMGMFMPGSKKTVESFEQDLIKGKSGVEAIQDGWLEVRPSNPTEARSERVDRLALAKLLQVVKSKSAPTLDDLAAYAVASPAPSENMMEMAYLMLFVPGSVMQGMIGGFTNWDMLKVYGSLEPMIRVELSRGGRLPFANMSPLQQNAMRRVTFGAGAQIQVTEAGKEPPDPQLFFMAMMMNTGTTYKQEPTELLPSGLPVDAYLQLSSTSEPIASVVTKDGQPPMAPFAVLGPDELAMFKMFKSDPNLGSISQLMPEFGTVRLGRRTVYKFSLHLAPDALVATSLNDNQIPDNAATAQVNSLPGDFQTAIDERMAKLKKSPLGMLGAMMGGMGRGTIKP